MFLKDVAVYWKNISFTKGKIKDCEVSLKVTNVPFHSLPQRDERAPQGII